MLLIPNHLVMHSGWNSCPRRGHGITLTSSPSTKSPKQMQHSVMPPPPFPPALNVRFSRRATAAAGAGTAPKPPPPLSGSDPPPPRSRESPPPPVPPCGPERQQMEDLESVVLVVAGDPQPKDMSSEQATKLVEHPVSHAVLVLVVVG